MLQQPSRRATYAPWLYGLHPHFPPTTHGIYGCAQKHSHGPYILHTRNRGNEPLPQPQRTIIFFTTRVTLKPCPQPPPSVVDRSCITFPAGCCYHYFCSRSVVPPTHSTIAIVATEATHLCPQSPAGHRCRSCWICAPLSHSPFPPPAVPWLRQVRIRRERSLPQRHEGNCRLRPQQGPRLRPLHMWRHRDGTFVR